MDELRIGIVGMGNRTCHYGSLPFSKCKDRGIAMAALCDNVPEKLSYAKKVYQEEFGGNIATFADFEEMYRDADLDGVYVVGPNHLHKDMTVAALDAGINVLCEKPMEVSLAKCDEMTEAARRAGKILCMGMQMHYRKRYHKVKEIIDSGALGKVAMVWCTEYRGPFSEKKDWVWEMEKSGGAIVEKNCHHYDILDMWAQSNPTTVYATGNVMKHFEGSGKKSEIIDNAWVLNDYENGARAMVGICFLRQHGHDREFGVYGTEGRVFFSWLDGEIVHVEYNNKHKEDYNYIEDPVLRGGLEEDFINCIRTGEQPLVTPELGKKSLLVPMAAEISILEKRIVHVSELK